MEPNLGQNRYFEWKANLHQNRFSNGNKFLARITYCRVSQPGSTQKLNRKFIQNVGISPDDLL